ncbi:unnamed protein product [Peniophora sp. CBMAI 1063]|nr:unnamed protein product [Peniophora sp. CBMAI 1063]
MSLSKEQMKALRLVVNKGKSMFITSSAGTGKFFLLKHIIDSLLGKHSHNLEYVAVTASTGAAAYEIGGQTLHSWASMSPGDRDVGILLGKIMCKKAAVNSYAKAKVLIINKGKHPSLA